MKETKQSVLFMLALPGLVRGDNEHWVVYEQLYWLLPFQPSSIRGAVTELSRDRLLSIVEHNGKKRLACTVMGREMIQTLLPGLRGPIRKWDGTWTLVVVRTVVGKEVAFRATREGLKKEGYRVIQDGVYLKAGPFAEPERRMCQKLGTLASVLVMESKRLPTVDEGHLVAEVYGTQPLAKREQHLRTQWGSLITLRKRSPHSAKTRTALLQLLGATMDYYRQTCEIPEKYLPQEIQSNLLLRLVEQACFAVLPQGH